MSGEKEKLELKITDISFTASLKFWLAFLVAQVVVLIAVFFILLMLAAVAIHSIPSVPKP